MIRISDLPCECPGKRQDLVLHDLRFTLEAHAISAEYRIAAPAVLMAFTCFSFDSIERLLLALASAVWYADALVPGRNRPRVSPFQPTGEVRVRIQGRLQLPLRFCPYVVPPWTPHDKHQAAIFVRLGPHGLRDSRDLCRTNVLRSSQSWF